jgi:N-acetylmuramoyl-L-alanine amidase
MEIEAVNVITRDMWGAKPNKTPFSKLGEIKGLVVHWSAYPIAVGNQAEIEQVKKIQALHQNDRGWNDIAYNFLVGDTGQIYEGRGWGNRSAAQGGNSRQEINYNNKHYVAVCWLGGINPTDKPSDKAIESVKWLYSQVKGELRPHSSFKQTACPGDAWRQWIIEWDKVDTEALKKTTNITAEDLSNAVGPEMIHPQFIQKKLDTIIAKLENIENKLKLGRIIQ